ncbi:hypothetical protein HanXRQr2_Chr17g0798131 [Helianthus annuus]|uniref:Uncharacterized protein n=1 Tax=Helianthus annuus TaxID=4232 RepID=A0A251RPG1_HELAN|nr:hypothetical protein HanXRQr2_Chr17g0798131 [Helianthus annuus]
MRGGLGSVNQLSVTIGIMLAYLLGLFANWRILAILGYNGSEVGHSGTDVVVAKVKYIESDKLNDLEDVAESLKGI